VRTVTCLIVDDTPSFVSAATRLLEQERIAVVGTASGAADAVAVAAAATPDIALVDVNLGEQDGFEVAELLACLPGGGPRVILVSGDDLGESCLARVAASRALGFIAKIDLSARAIEQLLDARPGGS
jgi:DNA-binding NarL/FixJ family response regulator